VIKCVGDIGDTAMYFLHVNKCIR